MRRISASEVIAAVIGLLMLINGAQRSIPTTFNRVLIIKAELIQAVLIIGGILLIGFALFSYLNETPLTKQHRKIVQNIALLIIVSIICGIILEVFLQLNPIESCKQSDALLDHSYTPNCEAQFKSSEWSTNVKINSYGLRDEEPNNNAELKILVLGDSFTWGYGVEHNKAYTEVMQHQLTKQRKQSIDVINAGATSYSPVLQYLYLKNRGKEFKPDIIIMNFDMSDVQDDYIRENDGIIENNEIVAVPAQNPSFFQRIRSNIQITRFADVIFKLIDAILPKSTEISNAPMYNIETDRYGITRFEQIEDEQNHWNRTLSYIKKTAELSKQLNATFILTTYPYGHQISKDEWSDGRTLYGFEQNKIYSDRAEKVLAQFAKDNNIVFIPTFEKFKQSKVYPKYFAYDGHFTPQGHEVMADVIMSGLKEKKVLS